MFPPASATFGLRLGSGVSDPFFELLGLTGNVRNEVVSRFSASGHNRREAASPLMAKFAKARNV